MLLSSRDINANTSEQEVITNTIPPRVRIEAKWRKGCNKSKNHSQTAGLSHFKNK
jgi:hypothetical protein